MAIEVCKFCGNIYSIFNGSLSLQVFSETISQQLLEAIRETTSTMIYVPLGYM